MKRKIKEQPPAVPKRLLVLDDHPITRHGLTQLIDREPDLRVCCEASDARSALACIETSCPDLILADISLPGRSGLEFLKDARALMPDVQILVLSMHDEGLYAERVLRAGGRGYVMKSVGGEKILEAIRKVLSGGLYVSELMSARIVSAFSGARSREGNSLLGVLTDREFEVFQLIGRGGTTREIAKQLHMSVKTVETHRRNARDRLGLPTSSELVKFAIRWASNQSLT